MIGRPILNDAPKHCEYFFDLTKEDDLLASLENSRKLVMNVINTFPKAKENYRYAEGKWTVKMVFSHLIDCERHYSYFAMCRSRRGSVDLVKYDQDLYAMYANTEARTLQNIGEEFSIVRESTKSLFKTMTDEMLDFKRNTDKVIYTPRSLGWMASGHSIHHCNLIKEKYLK